jgi:ribosome-binding protein aMBF1 (putative translation factor)
MTAQIIPLRKVAKPRARRGPYRKYRQRRRYEFYRAFGRRLRYARHQLGISEQAAAEAFDVTVRTYRRYEAGKPTGGGYADFADTFGVSLEWLVGCKGAAAEAPRLWPPD